MEKLAKKLTRYFLSRKGYQAIPRTQDQPWAMLEASPLGLKILPPQESLSLSLLFSCAEKKTSVTTQGWEDGLHWLLLEISSVSLLPIAWWGRVWQQEILGAESFKRRREAQVRKLHIHEDTGQHWLPQEDHSIPTPPLKLDSVSEDYQADGPLLELFWLFDGTQAICIL